MRLSLLLLTVAIVAAAEGSRSLLSTRMPTTRSLKKKDDGKASASGSGSGSDKDSKKVKKAKKVKGRGKDNGPDRRKFDVKVKDNEISKQKRWS